MKYLFIPIWRVFLMLFMAIGQLFIMLIYVLMTLWALKKPDVHKTFFWWCVDDYSTERDVNRFMSFPKENMPEDTYYTTPIDALLDRRRNENGKVVN